MVDLTPDEVETIRAAFLVAARKFAPKDTLAIIQADPDASFLNLMEAVVAFAREGKELPPSLQWFADFSVWMLDRSAAVATVALPIPRTSLN